MTMRTMSLGDTNSVSAPAAGLAPGSSCYDATHDGGEIHCASIANVLLSAINPFAASMTTTCSDAEMACLQTAPASVLSAATDICTPVLGISCSSLAIFGVIGIVGLMLLKR